MPAFSQCVRFTGLVCLPAYSAHLTNYQRRQWGKLAFWAHRQSNSFTCRTMSVPADDNYWYNRGLICTPPSLTSFPSSSFTPDTFPSPLHLHFPTFPLLYLSLFKSFIPFHPFTALHFSPSPPLLLPPPSLFLIFSLLDVFRPKHRNKLCDWLRVSLYV